MRVIIYTGGEKMTAKEMVRILKADGWIKKAQKVHICKWFTQ